MNFQPPKPPKSPKDQVYKEKSIQRVNNSCMNQSLWLNLLNNIDINLCCAHDYDDIIVISLPYPKEDICEALYELLNKLHLVCMSSLIIEYLFVNKKDMESKLHLAKIENLMKTMAIIIIDIQSLQIINIPKRFSDLSVENSCTNDHFTDFKPLNWTITWSTVAGFLNTPTNFHNLMTDICQQFESDENIMKNFIIYNGNHIKNQQEIIKLQRSRSRLEHKIRRCETKANYYQTHNQNNEKKKAAYLRYKNVCQKKLKTITTELEQLKLEQQCLTKHPSPMYEWVDFTTDIYMDGLVSSSQIQAISLLKVSVLNAPSRFDEYLDLELELAQLEAMMD